jgi:pimeloyl-ACP methyl ester carboxylesterase
VSVSLARSADGTRIAWRGAGAGAPLILSTPVLGTLDHWSGVEPGLAAFCRAIAWDYRGHGRSDAPRDPRAYSLELVLEDLAAVHDEAAGGEPAHLCGLSLGGLVSLCYALARPGRVRSLVLVNTGPGFRSPERRERWRELWERAAARLERVGVEAYLSHPRATLEILGRAPESPCARLAREGVLRSDAEALARFARGVAAPQPDLGDRLAEIAVPALVLCGEEDRDFQRAGQVLAEGLPAARHAQIAGAGHALPLDQPDAFARSVRDFLASL